MAEKKLVSDKDLAPQLGISVSWLQKDRLARRLVPYIKIGDTYRYDVDEVLAALRSRRVGPRKGRGT